MTKDEALYEYLKAQIRYLYYILDSAELCDYDYDKLEKKFNELADKLQKPGAWVGSQDYEIGTIREP